ncbi:CLUMA_CG003642, isoform A [Clunio marinus]|uniref:CLUMA_CG003642, isoform A n=1 Tax=Clunio marinus TaxID=568069 RepID=A0A1J1HPD7_9DIPT|nr:CLUMA_CG003642, isoform A [Clunio marinus]
MNRIKSFEFVILNPSIQHSWMKKHSKKHSSYYAHNFKAAHIINQEEKRARDVVWSGQLNGVILLPQPFSGPKRDSQPSSQACAGILIGCNLMLRLPVQTLFETIYLQFEVLALSPLFS